MNQEQAKTKLPRAWKDGNGYCELPLPQFGPYCNIDPETRERFYFLQGYLSERKGLDWLREDWVDKRTGNWITQLWKDRVVATITREINGRVFIKMKAYRPEGWENWTR